VDTKRNGDLLENHSFQDLNLPDYQYTVSFTRYLKQDEGML
jgi:hypothetical protein